LCSDDRSDVFPCLACAVEQLPNEGCRYGVFDVEYTDPKTGGQRNKIVFFQWCPDVCKVREKMIYASSKDELKKRLVGIATEVQGSDKADVEIGQVTHTICLSVSHSFS